MVSSAFNFSQVKLKNIYISPGFFSVFGCPVSVSLILFLLEVVMKFHSADKCSSPRFLHTPRFSTFLTLLYIYQKNSSHHNSLLTINAFTLTVWVLLLLRNLIMSTHLAEQIRGIPSTRDIKYCSVRNFDALIGSLFLTFLSSLTKTSCIRFRFRCLWWPSLDFQPVFLFLSFFYSSDTLWRYVWNHCPVMNIL